MQEQTGFECCGCCLVQALQVSRKDRQVLREAAKAQTRSALVPMLKDEPGMVLSSIPTGCPASSQVRHHQLPFLRPVFYCGCCRNKGVPFAASTLSEVAVHLMYTAAMPH